MQHDNVRSSSPEGYRSRLIVGTGKYRDFEETGKPSIPAQIVTVAVGVNITTRSPESPRSPGSARITILPNFAGCHTKVRSARVVSRAMPASGTS